MDGLGDDLDRASKRCRLFAHKRTMSKRSEDLKAIQNIAPLAHPGCLWLWLWL
jgi:hypothetical protein